MRSSKIFQGSYERKMSNEDSRNENQLHEQGIFILTRNNGLTPLFLDRTRISNFKIRKKNKRHLQHKGKNQTCTTEQCRNENLQREAISARNEHKRRFEKQLCKKSDGNGVCAKEQGEVLKF